MYNVDQYIGKCLDSCLKQDISKDEYEIIVVDDESPDNSSSIVEEYIKNNKNIRLIHRKNGGLSAARNTGLKEANGEYVWFVDSDDWIEENCLKFLTEFAEDNNIDVLCFGLQLVYPDGRKTSYNIQYEESGKIYKGEDFICKVKMPSAAWIALYKKEYLNKHSLSFFEGILHEDQEFTPRAYSLANSISFVNRIIYNYNQRAGSIMKSNRDKKRSIDLLQVANSLYCFINQNFINSTVAKNKLLNKVAFAYTQSLAYYKTTYFPIKMYYDSPCYPLAITDDLNFADHIKFRIVNLSIRLYLFMYKIIKKK